MKTRNRQVQAVIVPHSPYAHCGQCMAWAYKAVAETPRPDVYILIAVNHYSFEAGITLETFSTPLGFVRVDQELARTIISKGHLPENDTIHRMDPVLEVQLPFLMNATEPESEKLKILPVLLNPEEDVKEIAVDIKEALMELGRTAMFIVSTNFTQQGPLFHTLPFEGDIRERIRELDNHIFSKINVQEPYGIPLAVSEHDLNIDGWRAVELLLHIIPKCQVEMDQYYTSGDILNNYKNTVSYASFVFENR